MQLAELHPDEVTYLALVQALKVGEGSMGRKF